MDYIGANHGMVRGNVDYVPGKVGNGFFFDSSGFLEIEAIDGFSTTSFSFDLWVKPRLNDRDPAPVFLIAHSRGDTSVSIMPDGSVCIRSEWRHGGCSSRSAAGLFNSGELAHMSIVRDGGVVNVYKNGTRIGSGGGSCCRSLASSIFFGGTQIGSQNAAILLDEIRFHSRALSDGEVFSIYNKTIVSEPDEALLAELDEAYALIESLQQEITELTDANSELENQIITLENQSTIYIGQIIELEAQLDELEQRVRDLEGQVETLETKVSGLEDQVADLQDQVQDLKTLISDLEGQIRYLEEKVRSLQAELDALKNLLNSSLDRLEQDFRATFRDSSFEIQGTTSEEKLENLVDAIIQLNKGRKMGLYKQLR